MSEDDKVKDALKKVFSNPETSQRAVDLLVPSKTKPRGWARRSNASYYTEAHAIQVKIEIDKMMVDGKPRIFAYSRWPHMTPNSVYLRVNRGIRYLLEFMDSEGKYAKFLEKLDIRRRRDLGVELSIKDQAQSLEEFNAQEVVPQSEKPRWKQRIEHWLEHSEPGSPPFILENLALSVDEVRDLKVEFQGLKSVQTYITATTIKLIKVNL